MDGDDKPAPLQEQTLHTRLPGAAKDDGVRYEWMWAALLYLRCLNNKQIAQFRLGANVKGALPLDDVVLSFTTTDNPRVWYSLFIQLKYKQKEQFKLSLQMLTCEQGDFALLTYLNGIININNSINDTQKSLYNVSGNNVLFSTDFVNCFFILCTNAKANNDVVKLSNTPQNAAMKAINDLLKFDSETSKIFLVDHSIKSMNEATAKWKSFMNDHVAKVTNDEEVTKAFNERLFVGSGMPSVNQLEEMIKREMMTASSKRETSFSTCLNNAYISYEKVFSEWSKADRGLVLNNMSDNVLEKALEQIYHELNQMNPLLLPVNFVDELGDDLSFVGGLSVLNVVTTEKSMKLSFTKVVRLLEKQRKLFVAYNLKDLLPIQDIVLRSWELQSNTVLLIAIETERKELKAVCDKVSEILQKTENQKRENKVIFVSIRNRDVVQNIIKSSFPHLEGKNYECVHVHDQFQIDQLDEESKNRVMETKVAFRNVEGTVPLKSLCLVDDLEKILTDAIVDELLTSDVITVGPHLEDVVDYYIPRTLTRFYSYVLDKSILSATDLHDDVLVVAGMSAEQRQKWAPLGRDLGENNGDNCSVLFVKIDYAKQASILRIKPGKNHHYLKMEHDEVLYWRWGYGKLENIDKYFLPNEHRSYQCDSIFEMTYRENLVIAEPGMGKTTLLNYLARNFQSTMTKPHWIVRVNLGDHVHLLHEMKRATTDLSPPEQVLEFLAAASGIAKDSLEFALFRISLEKTGNVVVLLDGFDEIAQSFLEEGERLLKGLLDTQVTKVWVTARHSVSSKLKQILDTRCFTVLPFFEESIRKFFHKFWSFKSSTDNNVLSQGKLDGFIDKVLKLVSTSLGESGKSLLGIPLQSMLVAEAFYNNVNDPELHPLPDKINLLYLFEMFLERKFEISFGKQFPGILVSNVEYSYNILKEKSLRDLTRAAMILVITRDDLNKLGLQDKIHRKFRTFCNFILQSKEKSGVVYNVTNNQPLFVHRTFAEYLVALFFAPKYQQYRDFLRVFLFDANNVVIRGMFDRMLSKGHPLHEAVLDDNLRRVEELLAAGADVDSVDSGGRTALHLAASQGFQSSVDDHSDEPRPRQVACIQRFGHEHENSANCTPIQRAAFQGFQYSLDDHSVKPRPRHVIKLLLEREARHDLKDDVFHWIPLEFAIKTNSYDAIEYILVSQADADNPVAQQSTVEGRRVLMTQVNTEVVNAFTNLLHVDLPDVVKDGDRFTLLEQDSTYCTLHIETPGGDDSARHRYWITLSYFLSTVIYHDDT